MFDNHRWGESLLLDEFLADFVGRNSGEKEYLLIGMLYLDDSGSDTQSEQFTLGGYHSPIGKWAEFSKAWISELNSGPIKLEYFKMSEAMSMSVKGQFAQRLGWTPEARDQKLINFARIIEKYCERSFFVSIKHSDYEATLAKLGTPNRRTKFDDQPYHMLFGQMTLLYYNYMHKRDETFKQSIILDNQEGYTSQALWIWRLLSRNVALDNCRIASKKHRFWGHVPSFKNDKEYVPIQAADYLSWIVRRRLHYKDCLLYTSPSPRDRG